MRAVRIEQVRIFTVAQHSRREARRRRSIILTGKAEQVLQFFHAGPRKYRLGLGNARGQDRIIAGRRDSLRQRGQVQAAERKIIGLQTSPRRRPCPACRWLPNEVVQQRAAPCRQPDASSRRPIARRWGWGRRPSTDRVPDGGRFPTGPASAGSIGSRPGRVSAGVRKEFLKRLHTRRGYLRRTISGECRREQTFGDGGGSCRSPSTSITCATSCGSREESTANSRWASDPFQDPRAAAPHCTACNGRDSASASRSTSRLPRMRRCRAVGTRRSRASPRAWLRSGVVLQPSPIGLDRGRNAARPRGWRCRTEQPAERVRVAGPAARAPPSRLRPPASPQASSRQSQIDQTLHHWLRQLRLAESDDDFGRAQQFRRRAGLRRQQGANHRFIRSTHRRDGRDHFRGAPRLGRDEGRRQKDHRRQDGDEVNRVSYRATNHRRVAIRLQNRQGHSSVPSKRRSAGRLPPRLARRVHNRQKRQ